MEFIETSYFTRHVYEILTDDEYTNFQDYLADHPDAGDVIPDTGGMRKIRIASGGKGKRGGSRVIYYWQDTNFMIFLMAIYAKNRQIDLTVDQKRVLRTLLEEMKNG